MIKIDLTWEQVEVVVREALKDQLSYTDDMDPALETAMILVLDYYSVLEHVA